jgi:hypothetical protein
MIGNKKSIFQALFFPFGIGSFLLLSACASATSHRMCEVQFAVLEADYRGAMELGYFSSDRLPASNQGPAPLPASEVKRLQNWTEKRLMRAQRLIDALEMEPYSEAQQVSLRALKSEVTQLTFLYGHIEVGARDRMRETFELAGKHDAEARAGWCFAKAD